MFRPRDSKESEISALPAQTSKSLFLESALLNDGFKVEESTDVSASELRSDLESPFDFELSSFETNRFLGRVILRGYFIGFLVTPLLLSYVLPLKIRLPWYVLGWTYFFWTVGHLQLLDLRESKAGIMRNHVRDWEERVKNHFRIEEYVPNDIHVLDAFSKSLGLTVYLCALFHNSWFSLHIYLLILLALGISIVFSGPLGVDAFTARYLLPFLYETHVPEAYLECSPERDELIS